jgi:hypothetical protein
MHRSCARIVHAGIVTEPAARARSGAARAVAAPRALALERLGRALAVRHVDAGSCNGCELEIHALGNPYYNLEGLGMKFVASPRHADLLLVTGPVSRNMEQALLRTYAPCRSRSWSSRSATAAATEESSARATRAGSRVERAAPSTSPCRVARRSPRQSCRRS